MTAPIGSRPVAPVPVGTRSNGVRPSRVLMLLGNNPYPQDPRVRNEATALRSAGHLMTVIAPRDDGQPFRERIDGVSVVRFPRLFRGGTTTSQVLDHVAAAAFALVLSVFVAARPGFDVVHVHNPPDTLGLVAVLWQRRSRKFAFDHHDLAPEMYIARSPAGPSRSVQRALGALEALCCRRADRIIATNGSYRDLEMQLYGTPRDRISIVRNGPDTKRFGAVAGATPDPGGRTTVLYAGVIGVQDGVDELVRVLHHLVHRLGRSDIRCVVVGDGDGLAGAKALALEVGVEPWIEFTGLLSFDEMVDRIGTADVCVEPAPSNGYNDRSTTIKVMEYMAAGKPVVAYDLPEHRVTGGEAVQYVTANQPAAMADVIAALADDPVRRRQLGRIGRQRAKQLLDWSHQAPAVIHAYALLDAGADR